MASPYTAPSARVLACALAVVVVACAATPPAYGPMVRAPAAAPAPSVAPRRLTVVSWNVDLGGDADALAAALREAGLGDADVYLLQELEDRRPDEPRARAEALAAALGLAVVYAPARGLGGGRQGTHGLAVLSRWPIAGDAVLRLPHRDLRWYPRPRIALGVALDVAGTPVQVWTTHLDPLVAPEARVAQLAPVFERARALPGLAIVGADLNTWSPAHEQAVDALARREGFVTPTAALTDTVQRRWPALRLDGLYARGFAVVAAGVARGVRGSDHAPIWVQLAWPTRPGP